MSPKGGESACVHLPGIAAAQGVAVGPVVVLDRRGASIHRRRLAEDAIEAEVGRFHAAVEGSRAEIEQVRAGLPPEQMADYGVVLDAHLLMHGDALFVDATIVRIREGAINAEWALRRTVDALKAPLLRASSAYFRERADDIEHVGQHVLRELSGGEVEWPSIEDGSVLAVSDLSPADAARLLRSGVAGLATVAGSATGHTALLARALEIPAVVGVTNLLASIEAGEQLIVDGLEGHVIVDADADELARAEARGARYREFASRLRARSAEPTATVDGVDVEVWANIELALEAPLVVEAGATGIGLFRTEYLYLDRDAAPSEDEQAAIYEEVVRAVAPKPVVFRTFDLGGDKLPAGGLTRTQNPALGRRAIRLSLAHPKMLRDQVRAVLRAATLGSVSLMFPLVSSASELRRARAVVEQCRAELEAEGVAHGAVPVGIMVEVPSAAVLADVLARECDFFSVGTNDLVQYTLAADRSDAQVADIADAMEPAVLRLLDMTARAAQAADIPLSMCGDMAADPFALPLVIGLGYRRVSVPPASLPLVREVVRRLDVGEAEAAAQVALGLDGAGAVHRLVIDRFGDTLSDIWKRGAEEAP